MDGYRTRRVDGSESLAGAHEVRRRVFVAEQGVPEAVEMDDADAEAVHYVLSDGDDPVATARLRTVDADTGKAERVAVLPAYRGEGLGKRLMELLEAEARDCGLSEMRLHAQTTVEAFYATLGYETVSGEFEEAGIPHVEMVKPLET
jgi:predicted GNAT family N-acyltransferase